MTCLGMATADLQDLSLYTTQYIIISSTKARTGTYSFYHNLGSSSYIILPLVSTSSTVYGRVCFNIDCTIKLLALGGNTTYGQVYIYTSGQTVAACRGNYNYPLAYNTFNMMEWNCLEFKAIIHDSLGEIIIKINGVEVINITGVDTKYSTSTDLVDRMMYTSRGYTDDIIVYDNQWPGQGGLYVLKPNAGSTNENWTASAGNPEDCVGELPVSFTDYIYTAGNTPDTEHLVGIESLPATANSVGGVGLFCNAKTDQTSDAKLRTLLKSGTTTSLGTAQTLSTSESWLREHYQLNPDDAAAWENADIDALEIGVETQ